MKKFKDKARVLAIPDLHLPFAHPDAIEFLTHIKKKYSPDVVVCLGDELDMSAMSQHDHDPDGLSAGDELREGIKAIQPYYDLFPHTFVCTSNHTARPFRRAYKFGIPKAYIKSYHEFMEAPKGWVWNDSWEVDGVVYEHGEGFTGAQAALKAALANMESTVIGHVHSHAGIAYSANEKHLVFGFNVGCLIDKSKYAFAYGKVFKSKPIIGAGMIDKGIPQFIPMLLDKTGRWVYRKGKK